MRAFEFIIDINAKNYWKKADPSEPNRFEQVKDLIPVEDDMDPVVNRPKPQYANVSAVTTDAGGGVNGPKNVDDLRGDSLRIYGRN
jgi:hypothetical protein